MKSDRTIFVFVKAEPRLTTLCDAGAIVLHIVNDIPLVIVQIPERKSCENEILISEGSYLYL